MAYLYICLHVPFEENLINAFEPFSASIIIWPNGLPVDFKTNKKPALPEVPKSGLFNNPSALPK